MQVHDKKQSITAQRAVIFANVVRDAREITRGDLRCRLRCSEQTLAREYKSYLEIFTDIMYLPKRRVFRVV